MIVGVLLAVALGSGLAACSDDDDSGDAKGEVVITCGSCQKSPTDPFLQYYYDSAQRFNKKYAGKYRIEVDKNKFAGSAAERVQHYQRLALAEDLPDVFELNPAEIRKVSKTGKLLNFAPALDDDPSWKDSFQGDAFTAITGEGDEIWAIPITRDAVGIYYNKAIFRDAGITKFPTTWDELDAACEKIKASGKACFAMDGEWVTLLMWANLIGTQSDGDSFLESGIRESDYSSDPAVVEASERLKKWHTDGFVNEDSFSGEYQTAATPFVRGQAAVVANGPWMVSTDIKSKNAIKGLYDNVGYETSPGWTDDERGVVVISAEGSLASGATDERAQEAVVAFMKFMTSHPQEVEQIQTTGAYPAAKFDPTAAERKQLEPLAVDLGKESTSVPRTYPTAYFNSPPGFSDAWKNLWPAYAKGDIDTDEFLSRLAQEASSPTG